MQLGTWNFPFNIRFLTLNLAHSWVQFSSVTQSCLTLCNPTECTTPGFLAYHQLLGLVQTHVCQVSDAMQPSHSVVLFPSACLQYFPASGSFFFFN